ncbi:Hint domain-containing protein [Phaeobacter sp. JH18-32]|uniref:Hint domain-containing protein n=1 Tax=Phaeobacter TaxID=302485 RepID=UPI003A8361EF
MTVGYLVTLGDGTLDAGDGISANQSNFTSADVIGTGSWTWSGVYQGDGQTYSNISDTGTYHYGSDGNVYFVPDTWYTTSGSGSATTIPANSMSGTSGNDAINGDANDNVIYGGDGDDYLTGSSGDDIIFGGEGNDNYDTDTGNDTFYGEGGDDWVAIYDNMDGESLYGGETGETLGDMLEVYGDYAGVDVNVTFTGDGDGTVTFAGQTAYFWEFERFYLHSGDDTLDGSAATSALNVQTGSGANSVTGGAGDDTISTGAGADVVDGGAGDDLVWAGVGADTVDGGAGADRLFGQDDNDLIYGGKGSDTIDGGLGDDTIYGGENPATSVGGSNTAGNTYTVIHLGAASEVDSVEGNAANENPNALLGTYGSAGAELYNNFQTAIASDDNANTRIDFDDEAAPETININGVDKLVDTGMVYNATVTFTDGTTGTFTAVVIQTTDGHVYMMPEASNNAENVLLTSKTIESISLDSVVVGYSNVTATRVDADYALPGDTDTSGDSIIGGAGADVIYGGAGNDTIAGGTGADSIDAGDDADLILLQDGFGNDTIVGGEGGNDSDTLSMSSLTGPVTVTYTGDEMGTITNGTDTVSFSEIERLNLTEQADVVNASADSAGVDIDARGGDDTITGGAGADSIKGGSGSDSIVAGAGADTIVGGIGDDTIRLTADADRDQLVLADGAGSDLIYDFDLTDSGDGTTVDQLDVSGLTNLAGDPVKIGDVVVTDTNGDGTGDAIMTFPNGESITLVGVQRSQVDNGPEMHAMGIPCFTAGTLIQTPTGRVKVEDLSPGDRVSTMGAGAQQILWVGASSFTATRKRLSEALMPVRLDPDAFGGERALLVSPQHCVLMKQRSSGRPVHVRAKHLAQVTGFASFAREVTQVTYVHVLLKKHENILSNGIPSETFYPGPMAVSTLGPADRLGLFKCLPQLILHPVEQAYGPRVLPVLTRREVQSLARAGDLVPWLIGDISRHPPAEQWAETGGWQAMYSPRYSFQSGAAAG